MSQAYLCAGFSMAKCTNFRISSDDFRRSFFVFQHVPKAIAFGLNTLVFVQTMSYSLKGKTFPYSI